MAIDFNHTIVSARDSKASSRDIAPYRSGATRSPRLRHILEHGDVVRGDHAGRAATFVGQGPSTGPV
jgi:hypothetical protein